MTRVLHWFRRDLRVRDNTALIEAARIADGGVVGVFVVSPAEWRAHDEAAVKVDFWVRCLRELERSLKGLRIPLVVVHAKTAADVPVVLVETARRTGCDAISFNAEYELDEARRDEAVRAAFEAEEREVIACHDRCILAPGSVRTNDGGLYTVFTPFQNRFVEVCAGTDTAPAPGPRKQRAIDVASTGVPERVEGFDSAVEPELWPAGEAAAEARLEKFLESRARSYGHDRDYPAVDGTSTLSPYLAAGVISPRVCMHAAIEADGGKVRLGKAYKGKPTGFSKWVSELIWREFYTHLLCFTPRLSMHGAFKEVDRAIPWRYDEADFRLWCEGRTGYPIVDAGMRQLNATGWMHNRVRMIVAMFLTKDLLIDWRWGERYFMRRLVDGDLASNNGGWQWSASTGTDAAPYFRVYNPVTQAERYDPEGEFIRRWVPELAGVEGKAVFDPSRLPGLARSRVDYPEPMVDHAAARERVMRVFKAAGGGRPEPEG